MTGCSPQFGPGVKAWVRTPYFAGGMSEPELLEFPPPAGLKVNSPVILMIFLFFEAA
jgi:hypothetical protein